MSAALTLDPFRAINIDPSVTARKQLSISHIFTMTNFTNSNAQTKKNTV